MSHDKVKSMEELASLSGISRPTLSKYFNNPESVRENTRERIKQALKSYRYTPNVYAINQNRQSTRNIGVLVPFLADPFFAEVARKLEKQCAKYKYNPILLSSQGDCDQEMQNLESLMGIKPSGVVIAPLGKSTNLDRVRELSEEVSTVIIDCDLEDIGDAYFGSNNTQSVSLIVDYLCKTGEPPAFFEMAQAPNPNANKRTAAYEKAMHQQNHEPMILTAEGSGWEFENIGYTEGKRMIRQKILPSSTILCSNDRLAIGFMAAAYECGLRVGRGESNALRIAGHDDHPYARYTCPSLTTVSQDYDAISENSMNMLLSIIETGNRPSHREVKLFNGLLLKRKSA